MQVISGATSHFRTLVLVLVLVLVSLAQLCLSAPVPCLTHEARLWSAGCSVLEYRTAALGVLQSCLGAAHT